jgi:23S rRNA (guanine745-N1)-methyltransferase
VNCLSCSVRGCGLPLIRQDRALACPSGHSFDIARSGYVNLLQPQDRRSAHAGDSKLAIGARSRLLDAGVGRTAIDAIVTRAAALAQRDPSCVVDLGCGSGEALAMLAAVRPIIGVGIDLSTAAVEAAARRFPSLHNLTWAAANADRRLPLLDGRVSLVLSLNGRRNPAEVARVLQPDGHLLVAVPAPDDLIELRGIVQGQAVERDRAGSVIAEHESLFDLVERISVHAQPLLERDQLLDLLRGTYRGARAAAAARVDTLDAMAVTLALDVLVFRRRTADTGPGRRESPPAPLPS